MVIITYYYGKKNDLIGPGDHREITPRRGLNAHDRFGVYTVSRMEFPSNETNGGKKMNKEEKFKTKKS